VLQTEATTPAEITDNGSWANTAQVLDLTGKKKNFRPVGGGVVERPLGCVGRGTVGSAKQSFKPMLTLK
jgi:hypothetical protein